MALDNLTLLFSLALVSGLMAASLALTSHRDSHDGLRLWAIALAMESAAWTSAALRGHIPDAMSIVCANMLLVTAQSVKLAAIHEYRGMGWPRRQCLVPLIAMQALLSLLDVADLRNRIIYGSLIYAAQMFLLARALRQEEATRGGRAWWLIYGVTLTLVPMLLTRAAVAMAGVGSFAAPQSTFAPNAVQLLVFVSVVALDLLGAMGFILLVKERAEREVLHLAMTDGLTGIFNRRAFMDRADRELAIAQRNRQPLSLLMFDIDHFKRVNDTYGHAAGDAVLVEISKLVTNRLRKQDTFGRYGGEEFCILLPATSDVGVMVVAEELRRVVESAQLKVGQDTLSVTISIGISVCHVQCAGCPDFGKILKDADRALYQSKEKGRNQTILMPLQCELARSAAT